MTSSTLHRPSIRRIRSASMTTLLLLPQSILIVCLLTLSLTVTITVDAAAFTPPASVTFASIAPIATSTVAAQYGQPGLFAMKVAIDLINNRSAAWRADPTLPKPLCPYTTINLAYYDSKNNPGTTVNAAYDAINTGGAIAIYGEWASALAPLVQYVAQRYHVPQMSGSVALDLTLKHDTDYPYFVRNQNSIGSQAFQMAHLIKRHFGWNKFAIIGSSDTYGAGGTQIMVQTAADLKMNLLAQISFNLGEKDLTFHIQRLVTTDARIIAFWSGPADWVNLVQQIRAGVTAGLWPNILGDGYQWVLNVSPAAGKAAYTNSTGAILPEVLEVMSGMIALQPYVDTTTPEYQEYDTLIKSQAPWSVTPLVNPQTLNLALAGAYTYDGVMQMIRGLDFMLENEADPTIFENRADFYQAIRNRTFTGVTGHVENDVNGDRLNGYAVVNFQRSTQTWVTVGQLNSNGSYTPFASAPPIEYLGSDDTKYQQPPDTPPRTIVEVPDSIKIGMIIVSGVLILLFTIPQFFLFWYRDHNLIKGSSPIFLQLFVVGVQLLCASTIPRALEGEAPHACEAALWCSNIGYTLLVGALLVKTYRLQSIFNMNKLQSTHHLGDKYLLGALAGLLLLESGLLLGLQYGAPISSQLAYYDTKRDYYSCRAGSGSADLVSSLYLPTTIAARFALLCATAVMAFRVRNLPDMFNESRQLVVTVYNLLFLSILLPAIDATMGRGKSAAIIAYDASVFFICTISILIMFIPKLMSAYALKKKQAGIVEKPKPDDPRASYDATQLDTDLGGSMLHSHSPAGDGAGHMTNKFISPSLDTRQIINYTIPVMFHTMQGTPPSKNVTLLTPRRRFSLSGSKPGLIIHHLESTPEQTTRTVFEPPVIHQPSSHTTTTTTTTDGPSSKEDDSNSSPQPAVPLNDAVQPQPLVHIELSPIRSAGPCEEDTATPHSAPVPSLPIPNDHNQVTPCMHDQWNQVTIDIEPEAPV